VIEDRARSVLKIEADAIQQLVSQLPERMGAVVHLIAKAKGRIILSGIGKSGIICRKIAATLSSTGTPAFFLHPAEAIHGDLGMIVKGDIVIAISNSGETEELVRLLEYIKRMGAHLVAITGKAESTLAKFADEALVYQIAEEGCPLGLAPMASTTVTLALGDALAAAIMEYRGFTQQEFAQFHPGGKLGAKLLLVKNTLRPDSKPLVDAACPLAEALVEMSEKRLGVTAVDLGNDGLGIISDGDVRRLLQRYGQEALGLTASEVCSRDPRSIQEDHLAAEALHLMEENKITALLVVDSQGAYAGIVHLHDLWHTHLV
jgi:arabinose-5-phosphate isomerase